MKRNRLEACWDAVRPMLIYLILFITIREVFRELLETAAITSSFDAASGYPAWRAVTDTVIIGIASAAAALPLLREGRRCILTMRRGSMNAWIAKRRDRRLLMGILPLGTLCLSALMNILLSGNGSSEAVYAPSMAMPVEAAVYGILTPFTEELAFRGIVWYRLRKDFPAMQAALLSSLLFGIAHADLRQGTYAFVMGMVFSLTYELTRRFEVPFLLHCTCNIAVLAASRAGWGEILHTPMWIMFFAVTAFLVFAYWGMRHWKTKQQV